MKKTRIPIFVTVDDNYVKFLRITLTSIVEHKTEKNIYEVNVIHTGLSKENKKLLKEFNHGNVRVRFLNVSFKLANVSQNFDVRDYYSLTTYYRLFLPELFPFEDKGLYIDCDLVLLEDIANLYNHDIGDNLLGAVADQSVQLYPEFSKYVEAIIGVKKEHYFNAGVLIMNLKEMRRVRLESKAMKLLSHISFKVAQDQDVLNVLCKNRVFFLEPKWNVMPLGEHTYKHSLIHYNLIYKPWNQNDIMYEEYFWNYAIKAGLYDELRKMRDEIPTQIKEDNRKGVEKVKELCLHEISRKDTYYMNITNKKKRRSAGLNLDEIPTPSVERQAILDKIAVLEKEGKFHVDAENDPPFTQLKPGDVDFLRKKWFSKIKTMQATFHSRRYFTNLIKKGVIVIDKIEGVENLKKLQTGAVITANHFNPFDSIPINIAVKKHAKNKKMFTIIREGNYTFPGIYGYFMRNCRSLPLSKNPVVLREMIEATNEILKRGDLVLIYPEESLWWNYRKPKPLKIGGFKFAAHNNVPVIPTFITMRDTDKFDNDGYPIQAYTLHILQPIYPDPALSPLENQKRMLNENYEAWKNIYEKVYKTPLIYTTIKQGE